MAYDGHGDLVLFGGSGPPNNATQVGSSTSNPPPGATILPTASATPPTSQAPSVTTLGDTWLWTAAGWAKSAASGPPARSGAAAAFDSTQDQVVLFGGTAGSGAGRPLDDTWTWNGSRWALATPPSSPPARSDSALADDPLAGGAVLATGSGVSGPLGDTWLWTGAAWSRMQTKGGIPARAGSVSAYSSSSRELLLFGGSPPGAGAASFVLTAVAPHPISTTTTTKGPAPTTTTPPRASVTPAKPSHPPTRVTLNPPTVAAPGARSALLEAGTTSLRPGELVTLRGSGFEAGSHVTISFHSTPQVVGEVVANSRGEFATTVAVPSTAAAGAHHFEATGRSASGTPSVLTAAVEVVGVPSPSRVSPAETTAMSVIALGLPVMAWLAMGGGTWLRRKVLGVRSDIATATRGRG
jgi:hypothetical protein